ncbi:hypothetical protein BKA70DRAFT_1489938 [Coprinopsis sp. MPI-PUGE-AT-0042]|nr:hypothetical protein BKA70DRAFT_1489938 [Coprinopsis sp. MPI-PUGE-AT-0042]
MAPLPMDPEVIDLNANANLLDIPREHAHLLPNREASVLEFCGLHFPARRYGLLKGLAFRKEPPSSTFRPAHLAERDLPPISTVREAKNGVDEALAQGYQSICDTQYPQENLPVWSLEFWGEMHDAVENQVMWRIARQWLNERGGETAMGLLAAKCLELLGELGWRETLKLKGGGNTSVLAPILSDAKIRGIVVDLMMCEVQRRIEGMPQMSTNWMAVTLDFLDYVGRAWKDRNLGKEEPYLKKLKKALRGSSKILLVPAHLVQEWHYVAIRIDFGKRTLCYGDSLLDGVSPSSLPPVISEPLQWWLQKHWGSNFTDLGAALECATQRDGFSCAFTTVNMLASEVVGDPLWVPQRAAYERMVWFLRLAKQHLVEKTICNPPALPIDDDHPPKKSAMSIDHLLLHDPAGAYPQDDDPMTPVLHEPQSEDLELASPSAIVPVSWEDDGYLSAYSVVSEHVPLSEVSDFEEPPVSCTTEPESAVAVEARNVEPFTSQDPRPGKGKVIHPFFEQGVKRKREGSIVVTKKKQKKANGPTTSSTTGDQDRGDSGPIGIGHSAMSSRSLNESVASGMFVPSEAKLQNFREKCLQLDPHAEVNTDTAKHVRCSTCGQIMIMREPYNLHNFKKHRLTATTCKGVPSETSTLKKAKSSGAGMRSLEFLFTNTQRPDQQASEGDSKDTNPKSLPPCPGLTGPDVQKYVSRTLAKSGGGPTLKELAARLYGCEYQELNTKQKDLVRVEYFKTCTWDNFDTIGAVFSRECLKIARVDLFNQSALPCRKCLLIQGSKAFKAALAHEEAPKENKKYTPKVWVDHNMLSKYGDVTGLKPLLDAYAKDPRSPCILYAKGVCEGDYKDDGLFVSLVNTMVQKKDKEKRGVGLQGFRYAPDIKELSEILASTSPRAYQSLRNVLQLPTERALQINRARQPRFPIGITERTFDTAKEKISKLGYEGPLCLSCDDTQLLPALRPFYDIEKEAWYIIGGEKGPLLLSNPEEFLEIVDKAEVVKAKKLRLWCLQVPMPGIPTIVIAAMAIPGNVSAPQLVIWQRTLLDGLLSRGLKVVGCAHDGSSLERSIQRTIENDKTASSRTITLPHPAEHMPPLTISILLYGKWKQAMAMLQDSQHGLKTARNNSFSGARLLVLGNYVVIYEHFRRVSEAGPARRTDAINNDRQDDSAAIRIYSASVLSWIVENYGRWSGTIIYLFIFGELIDAYQNRKIGHCERVKMAMRAYFFIEIWEQFLIKAGYDKRKHFISKEAADIMHYLIFGLIKLIIIYRDGAVTYPLLPWLLSTEVCEHVFGILRQILPDFTILDFYFMVPKLLVRLRELELFQKFSTGKERTSGYTHSYHDCRDIDLAMLSLYPTDSEIEASTKEAFAEAVSLWTALGFVPTYEPGGTQNKDLPTVAAGETSFTFVNLTAKDFDPSPCADAEGDVEIDVPLVSPAADIQVMFEELEDASVVSSKDADDINRLAFANVSLSIDDSMRIHELPEISAEDEASIAMGQRTDLEEVAALSRDVAAGVIIPDASTSPDAHLDEYLSTDFSQLVTLRKLHQRKQAESGIREKTPHFSVDDPDQIKATSRAKIHKMLSAKIKAMGDRGVSATIGRKLRWMPGRSPQEDAVEAASKTGNSANAEEAAKTRVRKEMAKRAAAWKCLGSEIAPLLSTARVTVTSPLRASDADCLYAYGFVFVGDKLYVGRVFTIYEKSGGKNGKHGWTQSVNTIAAASNIAVQLYEQWAGPTFRAIPTSLSSLSLFKFSLIPSAQYLTTLEKPPRIIREDIQIQNGDLEVFRKLLAKLSVIKDTLKALNSRKKSDAVSSDED